MNGSKSKAGNRAEDEAAQLFSSAGAAAQGLRLRLEKTVVVFLEDLHSAFQEARRKFEDHKYREAYDRYTQFCSQFADRVEQWERKAEQRLQEVKNSHKPGKLEQLKTEIADVKKQSHSTLRLVSRLRCALEPLSRPEGPTEITPGVSRAPDKSTPARGWRAIDESLLEYDDDDLPSNPAATVAAPSRAAPYSCAALPPEFVRAFKASDHGRRLALVKQCFDVDSELRMEVVQTAEKRMTVAFDPPLESGRFFFLLDEARILRIDEVAKMLGVYDPEQDQNQAMPLKEFVRHVQGGVWLLRPKFTGSMRSQLTDL